MDEDKKTCTMCGAEFDTQEELDVHNKQVHGMGGEGGSTNEGEDEEGKMSGGM